MRFLPDHALIKPPRRCCTKVAEQRFQQKYGRCPPQEAWQDAVSKITGSAKFGLRLAERTSPTNNVGCESWNVKVDGELISVVYNTEQSVIVTILDYGKTIPKVHYKRYVL